MPITPTYPGVYIEEIPSGVRTIRGVATSITAFIGRTRRGPVDEPITLNSYGDFERVFGGLWLHSTVSFAVRDFYLNGGSQAIVVRLQEGGVAAQLTVPNTIAPHRLDLVAASEGMWGNNLRGRVDHDVSAETAILLGVEEDDLFNLTVLDVRTGALEEFRNLTVVDSPRRVDQVLTDRSSLVRVVSLPASRPNANDTDLLADAGNPDPAIATPALEELQKPPFSSDIRSTGVTPGDEGDDGDPISEPNFIGSGKATAKEGLYALLKTDLFNLLCLPPYSPVTDIDSGLITAAATFCEEQRAMLILDPPADWSSKEDAKAGISAGVGTTSRNAAIFFPRLRQPHPLRSNQVDAFVPCGAVAGIFARTDAQRGVWKAPAGLEATLNGVPDLSVKLTDAENGELNPLGVNCLRSFPGVGRVVWGSRTLQGADRLASEWKYIPVRRLALFLEESLYRGTQWVVFEPNDEPLWAQIRLNVGAFMNNLFRQGAFQGTTPREAYFVKCDRETTTQNDIDRGIVNIIVGFAPLKPAEFVIIKFQQIAGEIAS